MFSHERVILSPVHSIAILPLCETKLNGFWLCLRNSQHANGYTVHRTHTHREHTNDRRHQENGSDYLTGYFMAFYCTTISIPRPVYYYIISFCCFFIYGYVFDTPQSDTCFYCFISSIFDPATWWNYVRVWANNEWVNERRKEAANYIDKHQLCSKAITWLWKIELIDAQHITQAQGTEYARPSM